MERRRGKPRDVVGGGHPSCLSTFGTDFLSPRSKAGFISVNAGAPASHEYTLCVCPLLAPPTPNPRCGEGQY